MTTPRPNRVPRLAPRLTSEISGTKGRVRNLERIIAATSRVQNRATGPFFTIAAANTPDELKRGATLVASGSDDDDPVREAMRRVANGGTIYLLPGDLFFGNVIAAGTISQAKIRIIGSGGHEDENGFAPAATRIHAPASGDGIIGGGNVDFEHIACRFDGDTTDGSRGGVNVDNVRDCTFVRMYGTASDTVERCEYFGDYGGRSTSPIGSSMATGKRIRSCRFAMAWRDGHGIFEPTIEVVGCRFEFPWQYLGAEETPLFEELAIRTAISIAHNSVQIRGNVFEFGQGADGGACELGILCYEGSDLSIITDNVFQITAANPDGFAPAPAPEIAAAVGVDTFITVRNNVTSSWTADTPGDLSSVSLSRRFLEEQGFGT